ncbi:hypothetical protein [Aureispira sp. CCB-E]|uniref:hypothetical protein n=1 Tax=Aureispira sp. CCB-E TaxID=3051121 RepID=UPI002869539A|nr:hypothetical protein [Aureispira sp. CCB-E]WMX17476.1 hypothetical protein QP953_13930 [Aureispira sp. CCB-E]
MTEQEWNQAWDIYDSCIDAGGVPAHCEGAAQASFPDFSTTSQGGGSAIGQYFGNPGNWAGFASGITDVVGDIIGIANGRPNYSGDYMYHQQQQQSKMLWWVIGGVAAVFLIILLIIVLKK